MRSCARARQGRSSLLEQAEKPPCQRSRHAHDDAEQRNDQADAEPSRAAPARPSTTTAETSRNSLPPSARRSIGRAGSTVAIIVPWPPHWLRWPAGPAATGLLRHPTATKRNFGRTGDVHKHDWPMHNRDRGRSGGRRQLAHGRPRRPVEMAQQPGRAPTCFRHSAPLPSCSRVQSVDRFAVARLVMKDVHVGTIPPECQQHRPHEVIRISAERKGPPRKSSSNGPMRPRRRGAWSCCSQRRSRPDGRRRQPFALLRPLDGRAGPWRRRLDTAARTSHFAVRIGRSVAQVIAIDRASSSTNTSTRPRARASPALRAAANPGRAPKMAVSGMSDVSAGWRGAPRASIEPLSTTTISVAKAACAGSGLDRLDAGFEHGEAVARADDEADLRRGSLPGPGEADRRSCAAADAACRHSGPADKVQAPPPPAWS